MITMLNAFWFIVYKAHSYNPFKCKLPEDKNEILNKIQKYTSRDIEKVGYLRRVIFKSNVYKSFNWFCC
jgi:hypothetical protein